MFSFVIFARTIRYMKTLAVSLFIFLSAVSIFAAENSRCESGKISYKIKNDIRVLEVEICQNDYGQIYSKRCSDGCVFLKAIKTSGEPEVTDAVVGSPGGQICNELGFESYIADIEFKNSKIKNIDLCFSKTKFDFVSTGFLRDLAGSVE